MHKGGSIPPLLSKCKVIVLCIILTTTIMTKEMKAFITLIVSLIVFVLLLPFSLVIAVVKIIKGILNVIERTLTFFVGSIREEILK